MIDMGQFTPTEKRIMELLSDYRLHRAEEIRGCLPDEMNTNANIHPHLSKIRKMIRMVSHDIATRRTNDGTCYFLVRLLASPYKD